MALVSPAISHHAGRSPFKSPQANNSPIKHDCRRPSVSWPRYTNETDAQYTKRTGLDTLSAKLRGLIMNAIHANDQEPSQRSTNTRTSADSTSEAHAKKRGPSHGTEDPTIAANVSKRLAAAEMPPLPEPFDDGHIPSSTMDPPYHTTFDSGNSAPITNHAPTFAKSHEHQTTKIKLVTPALKITRALPRIPVTIVQTIDRALSRQEMI